MNSAPGTFKGPHYFNRERKPFNFALRCLIAGPSEGVYLPQRGALVAADNTELGSSHVEMQPKQLLSVTCGCVPPSVLLGPGASAGDSASLDAGNWKKTGAAGGRWGHAFLQRKRPVAPFRLTQTKEAPCPRGGGGICVMLT